MSGRFWFAGHRPTISDALLASVHIGSGQHQPSHSIPFAIGLPILFAAYPIRSVASGIASQTLLDCCQPPV